MKHYIWMLTLSLLIPIFSFSQNTYPKITKDSLIVLTPLQLKKTNLIFVEHSHLKEKNNLLNSEILIMDSIINNLDMTSNYYIEKIDNYNDSITIKNSQIDNLVKREKTHIGLHKISGIIVGILLIICLI